MMHISMLPLLYLMIGYEVALSASEGEANNPVFNLDHTALEKNIAAIFNKVAHSSATTKRSVPAYEAQVSQSTIHATSPSPAITSLTSSMIYPMVLHRSTNLPILRELPSYAPPSRALFTPPLPPEYLNPFADKPTLRGTNIDVHSNVRRPGPPPSLTPSHERIPIKPPKLIKDDTKEEDKNFAAKEKSYESITKDPLQMSDRENDLNDTLEFLPSLHYTSISRILSSSNGRKQDIPEILLKPIPTKSKESSVTLTTKFTKPDYQTSTEVSIIKSEVSKTTNNKDNISDNFYENLKKNESYNSENVHSEHTERIPDPQHKPSVTSSIVPDIDKSNKNIVPHLSLKSLESTRKIAWSLTATIFTIIALYLVYKIVRFNKVTNLLTQSYFLTIHLLLTVVCTLRCFHLFYDAYNLHHSLPEILRFIPSSLLAAAFATLILYMSRCSTSPLLYQNKFSSPTILIFVFIIHITVCISLHISVYIFSYTDASKILPLICQSIYIIICITLGLCYMYVYRVIRSHLHVTSAKSVSNHVTTDITTTTLHTAITTTIATALLFILMGFVQLYGIFVKRENMDRDSWLSWGWEFSVRVIELSLCSLLAWVSSLSQYHLREKQIQQHVHSGFALFPCGSSTSTENMDDALYPAICNTNQAIHNYSIRTGKHVYDDSFPLNTLPDNLNVTCTLERPSTRKAATISHFSQEMRNSFSQRRSDSQNLCKSNDRNKHNPVLDEHTSTSGSTMLVAEDGFVRFRNLGPEGDDFSDPQNTIRFSSERRNSLTCSDKFNTKQPTKITQLPSNCHQNSLSQLHLSLHRNQHQIYNNT